MYIQCTYILRTMYTCVHCVLVSVGGELGPPAVERGEGGATTRSVRCCWWPCVWDGVDRM